MPNGIFIVLFQINWQMKTKKTNSFRIYFLQFLCVYSFIGAILFMYIANDAPGRSFSVVILIMILFIGISWADVRSDVATMSKKLRHIEYIKEKSGSAQITKEALLWMLDEIENESQPTTS
jgi:hypothetical protein